MTSKKEVIEKIKEDYFRKIETLKQKMERDLLELNDSIYHENLDAFDYEYNLSNPIVKLSLYSDIYFKSFVTIEKGKYVYYFFTYSDGLRYE